jgi:SAM-dependent methyltransferase
MATAKTPKRSPTKFDPASKEVLVSRERREALDPQRVLSLVPIQYHQTIADIGCGPGYFTVPIAKSLFGGKVYALDATQAAFDEINLTNVEVRLSKEKQLPLDDGSLDGALIAFVLQESQDPQALLSEAKRCLKDAGWLAVLEWRKEEMEAGPPLAQRIDSEELRGMSEEAGFRIKMEHKLNGSQYMITMRK